MPSRPSAARARRPGRQRESAAAAPAQTTRRGAAAPAGTTRPPRPPMDERMLERRLQVRREQAQRRRRVGLSLLALVLLVGLGFAAARSPLFAIHRIEVSGVPAEEQAQVRAAAGIRVGENLLSVDLEAAAAGVRDLPWVADAHLVRLPPSALEIAVEPRAVAAAVHASGGVWVVDPEGWVISAGDAEGLARIDAENSIVPGVGAQIADVAIRNALAVQQALPAPLRSRIDRYDAPSERGLRLHLQAGEERGPDGVWVRFGAVEHVQLKAQVIQMLLDQVAAQADGAPDLTVSEIDVRAPDNPVLVPSG